MVGGDHDPGGYAARLICEGDTVILECRSNPHVVDIKFIQVKSGDTVNIAKGRVAHNILIGQPFGTRFEVCGRDNIKPVVDLGGGMADEILGELGEEAAAAGEESAGGDGSQTSRDNRELVDRNRFTHGRENSQKLGAEEIKEIKDQGKGAKEVMKALIENSDTFKHKTEFSQAKWLKKKAAKHAPQFTTARPSALTLCRAYFRKEPFKISHMREDTLARLLTLSNVQPGSRALVVDSTNGLVMGALAERMGGMGRLMHGFNGMEPCVEAVRWFNLDAECRDVIFHFPLSEVPFVPQEKSAVDVVMAQLQTVPDELAGSKPTDAEKSKGTEANEAASAAQGRDAAGKAGTAGAAGAAGDAGATLEARQRRIDGAKRSNLSFVRGVPPSARSVEETQAELAQGFDSLVVAGSLDCKLLVLPLLRLVKPSSPIVVYSVRDCLVHMSRASLRC
jgi:tRNA (adenine-N(1)-)-methyltransferase non-catalytic subunit